MATWATTSAIQGWGAKIPAYLENITVVNKAVSGRSARSYWREGKWTAVQDSLQSGDYVISHDDGGSPNTSDRASVGGGGETRPGMSFFLTGPLKLFTHGRRAYVSWMIDGAKSKGATPIISSQTPNNPYENSDTIVNSPPRNTAAKKGVPYVNHFAACISLYTELGKNVTESYFPQDHTHTNDAGADKVAWAFLSGLKCPVASGVLSQYVNSVGQGAGARC
ncbi:hypothetical protein FRC11_012302 [Ceratobasidium sp. 423]|nr:hypothetical protein FRC11_012302 [Ceratobasidium sp. 423]